MHSMHVHRMKASHVSHQADAHLAVPLAFSLCVVESTGAQRQLRCCQIGKEKEMKRQRLRETRIHKQAKRRRTQPTIHKTLSSFAKTNKKTTQKQQQLEQAWGVVLTLAASQGMRNSDNLGFYWHCNFCRLPCACSTWYIWHLVFVRN